MKNEDVKYYDKGHGTSKLIYMYKVTRKSLSNFKGIAPNRIGAFLKLNIISFIKSKSTAVVVSKKVLSQMNNSYSNKSWHEKYSHRIP